MKKKLDPKLKPIPEKKSKSIRMHLAFDENMAAHLSTLRPEQEMKIAESGLEFHFFKLEDEKGKRIGIAIRQPYHRSNGAGIIRGIIERESIPMNRATPVRLIDPTDEDDREIFGRPWTD